MFYDKTIDTNRCSIQDNIVFNTIFEEMSPSDSKYEIFHKRMKPICVIILIFQLFAIFAQI